MSPYAIRPGASRRVLARLLDAPDAAALVRRLDPRQLHEVVRQRGIEECGGLLALATTEQLTRILDEDLWTSPWAGAEEGLDADRFGLWLEVLAETSPEIAAGKLVELDSDLVTAAISELALVFDGELAIVEAAAAELGSEYESFDAESLMDAALGSSLGRELGGYRIVARRAESWDALLAVLVCLDRDHQRFFARLMQRCARLSTEYIVDNGGLYDVLSSEQQVLADAAAAREDRREAEGYVTPPQATAFLRSARTLRAEDAPVVDPVTVGYFRELWSRERSGGAATGLRDAVPPDADRELPPGAGKAGGTHSPRPPLPSSGGGERRWRVRELLLRLREGDAARYGTCTQELAYLANVLLSGCSFRSRRFRPSESADAALAVCNLGLESRADERSLVRCFQDGWRVLHEEVGLFTARDLAKALSLVECADPVTEREARDTALRVRLHADAGEPWRARDEIEVVTTLDLPSWAVLQGLLDECPVVPRDIDGPRSRLRVSAAFDFISEHRQIDWVREFVGRLPEALRP